MDSAHHLRRAVAYALPRLIEVPQPRQRPAPTKWSPQEVLGHLIDSAINNYARFVRAGTERTLVFEGYDQEAWVEVGRYADAEWSDLIELWKLSNHQLARLLEGLPAAVLDQSHLDHSLDRIAWRLVPHGEPTTLRYLVEDYVGHLQHHLRQIDPQLVASDSE